MENIGKTTLGELTVSKIGIGCMGMSGYYGSVERHEAIGTVRKAFDLGINFLDTADAYGSGDNEKIVGEATKGMRDKFIIATKFGFVVEDCKITGVDASPERVKKACRESLARLGTDYIDLYYLHRVDDKVPIEETVGAMGELVREGKVRNIGLSEVSAATLRKANSVFPVTALQTEYSLWSRDVEEEILPACKKLNIGFVAFSPLGRGFFTDNINDASELSENDFRHTMPRFSKENFYKNLEIKQTLQRIAGSKNVTVAQLSLAWLIYKGVVPIPGISREKHLKENAASVNISFAADELQLLNKIFSLVHGARMHEAGMKMVNK